MEGEKPDWRDVVVYHLILFLLWWFNADRKTRCWSQLNDAKESLMEAYHED